MHLPPRTPQPTFTLHKLSSLPDLRQAIKAWHSEFRDEGPYEEDVEALVRYLGEVVGRERDLGKAVGVVRWLGWVVEDDEEDDSEGEGKRKWRDAVNKVREGVQKAAQERGLGRVEFG